MRTPKNYYRVMLGKQSVFAKQCFEGGFIGTDFDIAHDLTGRLPEEWRETGFPAYTLSRQKTWKKPFTDQEVTGEFEQLIRDLENWAVGRY